MSNTSNRDGRIINRNSQRRIRSMLSEMCACIGQKATARALRWNPGPVHAIIVDGDFTQRIIYPEDVTQIELVHDVIMHYAGMSDEAQKLTDQLVDQASQFANTARELRRLLRRM